MIPKRNLLIAGGIFHDFEQTAPQVASILEVAGIESDITFDMREGMAKLSSEHYDLLTLHCLAWSMMQDQKYAPYRERCAFSPSKGERALLAGHVARGGGLLGIHTAAICFDEWPEWCDVLGVAWRWGRSHHPAPGCLEVSIGADTHPIVAGVEDFSLTDELYCGLDRADDVEVLASARSAEIATAEPVLTIRESGAGRVVYSALGHDASSFAVPEHQTLIGRAARWASHLL